MKTTEYIVTRCVCVRVFFFSLVGGVGGGGGGGEMKNFKSQLRISQVILYLKRKRTILNRSI